jgi:CheY-like chemotaxis protein
VSTPDESGQTTLPGKRAARVAQQDPEPTTTDAADGGKAHRATERPPKELGASGSKEPEPPLFEVGQVVGGHLEILSLLGAGGMAQVWEAKDRDLERRVAVKAAKPQPNVPPLRKEAQALAAFRHPSLVTVHAIGRHEGIDFIVMERIFGVSLAAKLKQRKADERPLALQDALRYLTAIAEGLAVVHRAGLAHRDVKPDNVMLTPDGRIVLMDFGLVVPEYDSELRGTVAGSPPYMAPETLRDAVAKGGGPQVDIYALGATAFELLTFEAPYADAESINHLFAMHLEAKIPSLRERRAEVPEELDQLVQEMLAKDPSERPQSAQGVAWQLQGIATRLAEPTARQSLPSAVQQTIDVLIVEDDDALARIECFYIEELFGKDRVRLRRAHDGQEAIDAVRTRAPDLLLLDLHLPKLNGIEVGMQIRGDDLAQDTKFVAISAGAQERDLQLLHLLGFNQFVPKGEGMKERLAEALRPLFPTLLR